MRVAVCEDVESSYRLQEKILRTLSEREGFPFEIRWFKNGEELEFAYADADFIPDIVLLDQGLPNDTGIDVASELRANGYCGDIIFVTMSPEAAVPAFDVDALRYVLKDSDDFVPKLALAVSRAAARAQERKKECIIVSNATEHRSIPIDRIAFFEVRKRVVTVHYGQDNEFNFLSSLTRLETSLHPRGFVRIHKSYLVNDEFIDCYSHRSVRLFGGVELPVGRSHYAALSREMGSRAITIDGDQ